MTLILIIFCIWGASALVRASKEAKRQRELEKQRREQAARSAEEAKENFLREKAMEAEFCGGDPAEDYIIVNVVEGFSA